MASVGMAAVAPAVERIERYRFQSDGCIPNSQFPALVYREVWSVSEDLPELMEARFAMQGWGEIWRGGLLGETHFHANAHEALGVARGRLKLRIGGDHGASVELGAGDVAILPAGMGHRCECASADLIVIGACPQGSGRDDRNGDPAERDEVRARIASVPLPREDPVMGVDGPLRTIWS